jgi:hypothetical protein
MSMNVPENVQKDFENRAENIVPFCYDMRSREKQVVHALREAYFRGYIAGQADSATRNLEARP